MNEYERKWKIKTDKNKFKIVPITVKKKEQIVVAYSDKGNVIGLKAGKTGIESYITEIIRKEKGALTELFL